MAKRITDIVKKTDNYSIRSADNLKDIIERKIKRVYVGALRCLEMRFGDSFDGYDQIRREILRIGNDAVRDLSQVVDNGFNVEEVPDVLTVFVNGKGKEASNGRKEI